MKITNEDNMQLMARYPDNYFELAIVDPPYGIGANGMTMGKNKGTIIRSTEEWDNSIPDDAYFEELARVSVNQIIWGGNYFGFLWPSKCFLVWDKRQWDIPYRNMADSELAWTSFDTVARTFRCIWDGFQKGSETGTQKIHPTQKPVRLYEWLLDNYAKEGDKILDTHLGSGSIAIACHNRKFDLTACELDTEYFDAAIDRIEKHKRQLTLF